MESSAPLPRLIVSCPLFAFLLLLLSSLLCVCVFFFRVFRLVIVVARSQIVFEVKPWEAEADLKGLFQKIRKVRTWIHMMLELKYAMSYRKQTHHEPNLLLQQSWSPSDDDRT